MQVAATQLATAASAHPSLRVLDLSCTAQTVQSVSALTGQGSKLRWHQWGSCSKLEELRLAGNSMLTAAAVVQLTKTLAAGGLGALRVLNLANCPGLSDAGDGWAPEVSAALVFIR